MNTSLNFSVSHKRFINIEHIVYLNLILFLIFSKFIELFAVKLKLNWDIHLKAQMAGAKDLKEVDDWMEDIHSNVDK